MNPSPLPRPTSATARSPRGLRAAGLALTCAALLAACGSVEWRNAEAAREMERASRPPGTLYTGWRVFEGRCAACHGADAQGKGNAPDLLPLVREMGPRRFMGLVLARYDWSLPALGGDQESTELEAQVTRTLRREAGGVTMPAWQGEPEVSAHIADLYAYLTARAEGTQGPGKPAR